MTPKKARRWRRWWRKTKPTVRQRGMGTGISEASKRVPIFSFATQGGKQVGSYFGQELSQGQELRQVGLNRLRFGSLLHGLSLKG